MGVRILSGIYDGTQPAEALVDSVTGAAFGPLLGDGEAEPFLAWVSRRNPWCSQRHDLRRLSHEEIVDALRSWRGWRDRGGQRPE